LRGLIVIGGNGSLAGARALSALLGDGCPVAGIPASIDNDVGGTSMAIGVDTALNTIIEACDRICDTASALRRAFIVEVMGRDSGYLAMTAAIGANADAVLIREAGDDDETLVKKVVDTIEAAFARDAGKRRVLIIKAEGIELDSARLKDAADTILATRLPGVDTRVTVLGHIVRGGSPSAFDRLLGARLGHAALRAVLDGRRHFMAGWSGPGCTGAVSPHDPYVVLPTLDEVLDETAKLLDGTAPLARWRKQIFADVEPMLRR
jgi:6-phosphofructokinase 1